MYKVRVPADTFRRYKIRGELAAACVMITLFGCGAVVGGYIAAWVLCY